MRLPVSRVGWSLRRLAAGSARSSRPSPSRHRPLAVSRQPHSASPAGNPASRWLKPARRVRKQSKVLRDRPRWDREEQPMRSEALFGISVLLCFVALGIVTALYIWPRLETMSREDALTALVVPHTFRFIGLSFLIPGVVSPSLPPAFAAPTAYRSEEHTSELQSLRHLVC